MPEQRTQKGPKRMERKAENKLKIYKCHQIKCRTHTHEHTHIKSQTNVPEAEKIKKERKSEREREGDRANYLNVTI